MNLNDGLKKLNLRTILATYQQHALVAEKSKKTYESYLHDLVTEETEQRRLNRIARLKKESKIPVQKTAENYDFSSIEGISAQEFKGLCGGDFLREACNIVIYGGHGLGKTHLAIALVDKLCEKGHRCLYTTSHELIEQMLEAKKELRVSELWRKYDRYDLIICDELGYIPQCQAGADLFFQFVSKRYERKSLLITTNLAYSDWGKVFLNETTTAAVVDRIIHRCKTYSLSGESHRVREAKKRST